MAILETAALTTIEEDKENVAVSLSSSSIVVRADSIYVRVYIYILGKRITYILIHLHFMTGLLFIFHFS